MVFVPTHCVLVRHFDIVFLENKMKKSRKKNTRAMFLGELKAIYKNLGTFAPKKLTQNHHCIGDFSTSLINNNIVIKEICSHLDPVELVTLHEVIVILLCSYNPSLDELILRHC